MADKPLTRDEMLAELVAALRGTEPPEDAFSVDDIMAETGWSRDAVYSKLKASRQRGQVEKIGKYNGRAYYRTCKS